MRLVIEAAARADITGTATWYNKQEPGLGRGFLDAIDARLRQIAKNPRIFSLRRIGIRGALLKKFPYIIFFKLTDDAVQIIAVFHQRRDLSALDERLN